MTIDFKQLLGSKFVIGIAAACALVGGSVAIASASNGTLPVHASSTASTASDDASDEATAEASEAANEAANNEAAGDPTNGAHAVVAQGAEKNFGQAVSKIAKEGGLGKLIQANKNVARGKSAAHKPA